MNQVSVPSPGYPSFLDTDRIDGLDPGIREWVRVLREHGIETFESCQGGEGHAFKEPTIRFEGERPEGFRALAIATQCGWPVKSLRRYWSLQDGEPVGPSWELVFWRAKD